MHSIASMSVLIRYFGGTYAGSVVRLTNKAVDVRFTLASGRTIVRRVSIVPTPSQRDHGRQPVRFTMPSADMVTASYTAFGSFRALLDAPNYRPTLMGEGAQAILANTYDHAQAERSDPRRAYRRDPRAARTTPNA